MLHYTDMNSVVVAANNGCKYRISYNYYLFFFMQLHIHKIETVPNKSCCSKWYLCPMLHASVSYYQVFFRNLIYFDLSAMFGRFFRYNGLIRPKYYPCNGISSSLNAVPSAILVPSTF
jgi:hypothetical protein